jgi:hypothetical protein
LLALALGIVIGVAMTVSIAAQSSKVKQAKKLLEKMKLVDGPGSGLDADTLRGRTPEQILALGTRKEGGGLVVRDAKGALVGVLNGGNRVVRRVGDQFFSFHVDANGFQDFGEVKFLYESPDCSGPAFLEVGSTSPGLISALSVYGTTGYYAAGPGSEHLIASEKFFPVSADQCGARGGGTFIPPDGCCRPCNAAEAACPTGLVSPVMMLDVSAFGLVPPFHVEGP